MKRTVKALMICLALPLAAGIVAGLLSPGTRTFYESGLNRPPLSPPGWVFPVVWTILYLMMGYASYLVWSEKECEARPSALLAYAVQLVLNFFWPLFFFGLRAYALAFFWLLLLSAAATAATVWFFRCSRRAGWWMIPYLAWLCFAAYLNLGVWMLN